MPFPNTISKEALAACRTLHKRHGTSYYFASRLFPGETRAATHVLYAFFRVPDEIVDEPGVDPVAARERFDDWVGRWQDAFERGSDEDPIVDASVKVFRAYGIPRQYGEAFLEAMRQDTEVLRYDSYDDLRDYMYGSAMVVGRMMSHVIGFREGAMPHADALGEAMQLTNFLRDIAEDYADRRRVYVPREDLERFGVSEDDIAAGQASGPFVDLMRFEIRRARELYRFANEGIRLLDRRGRFAVRTASELYEAILDRIEAQDYDVFASRARTSLPRKLALLIRARITTI